MSPVISKVEKEFIFKFLIQNKINIEIRTKKYSTFASLLEQTSSELKIELIDVLDDFFASNPEILVFFYFQNNYHTFKSVILKIQGNIAIIRNPEKIEKNLQRKFERIAIDGDLKLKFVIKGDLVRLNFPETIVNYYPNKPPIEADFFDVKIDKLLKKFKDRMSNLVSNNQIKMLRNTYPTIFEEQMIVKYGKILYIPDVYSDFPQKQVLPNMQILLKSDWVKFEILKNKTQAFQTNKALSDHLKKLASKDIYSIVIIPVLYRNYVVSFIYLINDLQKRSSISIKILDYSYQFSRLLSYALKENGYFKDEEKNTQRYIVPIYDLSPGGLAFKQNSNFFEDKLLLNHNANLIIGINKKDIKILGKLVRKFKEKSDYYYGFMFIDIKKDDFELINRYLYKK